MRLFLAGTFATEELTRKARPLYVLESFFYVKPWQMDERRNWKMFLLDSGAFTFMGSQKDKPVDWGKYLSSYIRFINENDVEHFFELDVDSLIGYEAVKQMRERLEAGTGKRCIPVWHRSRGLEEFKRMCADYPYIGIGGLAIKAIKPREYDYVKKLVRIADSYGTKVHGLGYTKNDLLDFGFYSSDSSTWMMTTKYGGINYFDRAGMVAVRPPKGMIGGDYRARREVTMQEWVKYQKYLDTKGKYRG